MKGERPAKKLSQIQIVNILIGLILLIVVIVLIVKYPCSSSEQSKIYKIVLAIACAGLASVIPGFFEFKFKGVVSAGGALAVFAFVFIYEPAASGSNNACEVKLTLKFYTDSARSEIAPYLRANVTYGNRTEATESDSKGEITLLITENLRGSEILINTQSDDFLKEQLATTIPPSASIIHIPLKKKPIETKVHGRIVNGKGQGFPGGELVIEGYKTQVESSGEFSFVVPFKAGTNVSIELFKDGKLIHSWHEDIQTKRITLSI